MNVGIVSCAALAAVSLISCKAAFDYDAASLEEREAWLDVTSQGIYDGLAKTLPKGRGGVYMTMGDRRIDTDRRRIDITVNVRFRGDQPAFNNHMSSRTVLKSVCPGQYLGTPLESNAVVVYTRYALIGGGTMLAARLSPEDCAPFA